MMTIIKDWPDEKLIEHLRSLHTCIYGTECYGAKDMILYGIILATLESRGWTVETRGEPYLVLSKEPDLKFLKEV